MATQRATRKAHPVEKSHIRATVGNRNSQCQSMVTLPAIGRNPERYEITHMTISAGPRTVSSVRTPAMGNTARGNCTDRTRLKFLLMEWAPAKIGRAHV